MLECNALITRKTLHSNSRVFMQDKKMKFRPDINGLRFLAVLGVVLFHFGVPIAKGGFVGVDVFFVISGFLMTSIIFGKLELGSFKLPDFYIDRCRRIIPALTVTCGTLLLLGWFLLPDVGYRTLSKQVIGSLTFTSNILFWLEASYFDATSLSKWLLHTWSLSVEWQFYIVYPVLAIVAHAIMRQRNWRWFFLIIAVCSFSLSAITSMGHPSASFYLLPTRAWEMLAGGLVYFFPTALSETRKRLTQISGLALIGGSMIFFDDKVLWPGYAAAVPVIGAALVLLAARQNSLLSSSRTAQFVGRISYSLYLWHWPVAVALYHAGLMDNALYVIGGLVLSVFLGWLSYVAVEQLPYRRRSLPGQRFKGLKTIAVACVCIGSAVTVWANNGFSGRLSSTYRDKTRGLDMPLISNGWCFYSVDSIPKLKVGDGGFNCVVGDKQSEIHGLLYGDSYAGHYEPFWSEIASKNGFSIRSITTNWCFPSNSKTYSHPDHERAFQQCLENRKFAKNNANNFDFVVLGGQWGDVLEDGDLKEIADAIEYFASKTKLVVVMAAPQRFDVDPIPRYRNALMMGIPFSMAGISKNSDLPLQKANAILEKETKKYENAIFLSRADLFSVSGHVSGVTADNIPFSFDGKHISIYGSKAAEKIFENTTTYRSMIEKISGRLPRDGVPPKNSPSAGPG